MTTNTYRKSAAEAVEDPRLQGALKRLQDHFGKGILDFWEADEQQEPLRNRVKAARQKNLEHLDILLTELAGNIEAQGGTVFFAATAEEARQYVIELARRHNVKTVVKGKSMVSAEIGIDPALAEAGIEAWETDTGEYIVQLDHDQPSHIIAPAVHLTKEQVGSLFARTLSIPYSDDPPTLTLAARKALREKFLAADMGITGCNLAIANTGQISLVSNEGNIRMSTTLPPVHVALMGMERIVANMEEHKDAIQLLTRGAAVQKISTYISVTGGVAPPDSPDGPKEFHLIIIDNGRSRILGDKTFREILCCIRCGACLNVCPVYGKIGGHAYNRAVYSGPIGAVVTPLMDGINTHADLCKGETLCGACLKACPVKNDIPAMLLALREKLAYSDSQWQVRRQNRAEGAAFALTGLLHSSPLLWRWALRAGRMAMRILPRKNGMITSLFGIGSAWTNTRDFSPLAKETFRDLWSKRLSQEKKSTDRSATGKKHD